MGSLRSPTLKPKRQNPRKPGTDGAIDEEEMWGWKTDWSSGGNRNPTFAGRRETRLAGCDTFRQGPIRCGRRPDQSIGEADAKRVAEWLAQGAAK